MLEGLFGNKNIQRILLFLFVNQKTYGSQLHHRLKTPLTPLQKALTRLEKGAVITSSVEGKTRLYQLNPAYPFLHELNSLLNKAYTLLPPEEKESYCLNDIPKEEQFKTLQDFWNRLSKVTELKFEASSNSNSKDGWNGRGTGSVKTIKQDNSILFYENGTWSGHAGTEVSFKNVFRWTLNDEASVISLEHLRRGVDKPVFLFHLAPSSDGSLSSVDSHLCGGDVYFGQAAFDKQGLRLDWKVIGPKKNEVINYCYS